MTKYKHLPEWAQEIGNYVSQQHNLLHSAQYPPPYIGALESLLQALDDALKENERLLGFVKYARKYEPFRTFWEDSGGQAILKIRGATHIPVTTETLKMDKDGFFQREEDEPPTD